MTLEIPALFMLPHLTTLVFSISFVLPFLSHKSPESGSSLWEVYLTSMLTFIQLFLETRFLLPTELRNTVAIFF